MDVRASQNNPKSFSHPVFLFPEGLIIFPYKIEIFFGTESGLPNIGCFCHTRNCLLIIYGQIIQYLVLYFILNPCLILFPNYFNMMVHKKGLSIFLSYLMHVMASLYELFFPETGPPYSFFVDLLLTLMPANGLVRCH